MPYGGTFGANTTDRSDHGSGASIDDLATATVLVMEHPTTLTINRDLVSKYRGADNLGWHLSNEDATAGLLIFEKERVTTNVGYRSSSLTRTTGNWYCSAVTWDHAGTPVARVWKGAYNAATAEPTYSTSVDGSGAFDSEALRSLFIGNRDVATPNQAYQGTLAIVAIYNRVLSQAEIDKWRLRPSYSIGSGCVLFVIICNNSTTGQQDDLSGNSNHGTLSGVTASATQLPLALHGHLANPRTAGRSLVGGGLVR